MSVPASAIDADVLVYAPPPPQRSLPSAPTPAPPAPAPLALAPAPAQPQHQAAMSGERPPPASTGPRRETSSALLAAEALLPPQARGASSRKSMSIGPSARILDASSQQHSLDLYMPAAAFEGQCSADARMLAALFICAWSQHVRMENDNAARKCCELSDAEIAAPIILPFVPHCSVSCFVPQLLQAPLLLLHQALRLQFPWLCSPHVPGGPPPTAVW